MIRSKSYLIIAVFIVAALVFIGLALLLLNIQQHKNEALEYPLKVVKIAADELDPAVWGRNFPREYDSFLKTEDSTFETRYGGSVPNSKLKRSGTYTPVRGQCFQRRLQRCSRPLLGA
jgi:nitrite reductase (cytochrome c-552)